MARYRRDTTEEDRLESAAIVEAIKELDDDSDVPAGSSFSILPGMKDEKSSELVRDIVWRQCRGYTDNDICRILGKNGSFVNNLEKRHPLAMDMARAQMAKASMGRYLQNMKIVTAALSDAGFHAIKTLKDVMSDVDASPSVRRHAAVDILNLLSIGQAGKQKTVQADPIVVENIINVLNSPDQPKASYMVMTDTVDAEVIDD